MRMLRIFSAVLSLFLLVPASIIWAQITKTINGTVRYESGMSETRFSTPNGNIIVYLPQSMTGSVISGTVSTIPEGKNEKEKNRNLEVLRQLVIQLPGKKIPLSEMQQDFEWLTDIHQQIPGEMILARVNSAEVLGKAPLSRVIPAPASVPAGAAPRLTTPSKLLVKGDALNVYTDQQFKPGEKFVLTDAAGQQFTVKPLCLSANQAVITAPEQMVVGELTIREEVWNQPVSKFDLSGANVKMIDIKLSSPNTNLRKGETSSVTVAVTTGENLSGPDSNEFMVFTINLRNLSSHIVTMEGGDLQRVSVNQFMKKPMEGGAGGMEFRLERRITGNAVGNFSVSATLHEDNMTCNDPFRPQLNVLHTPEDFNAWADALKKDLGKYASVFHGWDGDDGTGPVLVKNIQRAVDNMPVCTDPGQFEELKAVAYSLIHPLKIPKGAANTWLCGFEAYKAALKDLTGTLGGNPGLINREVFRNGLDFIRNIGDRLKDETLQKGARDAKKLVDAVHEAGKNKEQLGEIIEKLDELNGVLSEKASTDPSAFQAYRMNDLMKSSFIAEIPSCWTMDGTTAILHAGAVETGVFSLSNTGGGSYEMQIGTPLPEPIIRWAGSGGKYPEPFTFSITGPKQGGIKPALDFEKALITGLELPKMDAAGKDNLAFTVTLKPESVIYNTTEKKINAPGVKKQKKWMQGNFQFELEGLPCKNVTKIEDFMITPKNAASNYNTVPNQPGKRIDYREFADIAFQINLQGHDVTNWQRWFDEFVKNNTAKNGSLKLFDEKGDTVLSLPLNNVKPGSVIKADPKGDKWYAMMLLAENKLMTGSSAPESAAREPDRFSDLIGVFNPFSKTLFYHPEYQQQVFSKMQPVKRPDGKYDVNVLTAGRKPVHTSIHIISLSPAALFDQSVRLDEKINETLCGGQDTKAQDRKDRTPAERITEKWDSAGTGYRFYKNARCERFKEGGELGCREFTYYEKDKTGEYKVIKSGKYIKSVYSSLSHCFTGADFCTEMYFIDLIDYIYADPNCKRLIQIKEWHAWSCE